MTSLVACLSSGNDTWTDVLQLIECSQWESVFLVIPAVFAEKYAPQDQNIKRIIIDETQSLEILQQQIITALEGKLFGDVAVNLASGGGREHMAVLSALLKTGCGIRLVQCVNGTLAEI